MKRTMLKALVAGAVLVALLLGAWWTQRPEELTFRQAGSDQEAQALVNRMLAANQPWLAPQAIHATYSLHAVGRRVSRYKLYERIPFKFGPFSVFPGCSRTARIGSVVQTPLHSMTETNYSVHMLGETHWQGKKVVAVEVVFPWRVRSEIGLSEGFSTCAHQVRCARILIVPDHAIPLFIGTTDRPAFGAKPQFTSTWEFDPDFFQLDGGFAPRRLNWQHSWQGEGSFQIWMEFQVVEGKWICKQGQSSGGSWKPKNFFRFRQSIQMVDFKLAKDGG